MRFMRFGAAGEEIPAVAAGDRRYDLRSIASDIDGAFLGQGVGAVRAAVEAALSAGDLPEIDTTDMRVGSPIARPTAILCIGQNYAAHAAESGASAPEVPILFFKHPNTIVGPYDDVLLPPGAQAVDWEIELGIVIGKRARYLESVDDALDSIAGFVTSNDVSERDYQIGQSGGQWSKGKSAETFNPVGPELVTPDEVDAGDLRLWSTVNGEPRQDSRTSDMIFSAAQIVHHLSHYLVLEPGDLINTGTPEGVAMSGRFPYLSEGDIVEMGIEGLGAAQRQRMTAAVTS